MRITQWQKHLKQQLAPVSTSPALDANLLITHVTQKTREQLYTDAQETLSASAEKNVTQLLQRRLNGEPIAYLTGHKAFWSMNLIVTPDTLIPRPETECLVKWVLENVSGASHIVDLGTGSGAIAIALALEKPHWNIVATDQSQAALTVAKKNAKKYNAHNITFYQGDWCDALPEKKVDLIISNPPYIAENDTHLKQLQFEPQNALVSGANGLNAIATIIQQAKNTLQKNGVLVLEHGFDQADQVKNLLEAAGFQSITDHPDLANVPRFVTALK